MVLSRLTKITGPGIKTDTNWIGNNALFTGVTTFTNFTSSVFDADIINTKSLVGTGLSVVGVVTATRFEGPFTNLNVTGVATFAGDVSIGGTLTYEDVTNIDSVGIITARSGIDADDFISVGSNIHLGNAGVITATSFVGDGSGLIGVASTDNIVTGTAATFNTYPVDINAGMTVAGVSTFASDIQIADSIVHTGDTDTKITFPADNTISFDTAGSERLRIDSQGRLTVGATGQTSNGITEFHRDIGGGAEGCHILVKNTSTNSVNNTARLKLETSGGTAQFYAFAAASTVLTSRAGGTADLSLRADGSSKLRLYTNGNERLFINSSGHVVPGADSTYDLGLTGTRFRNVYADTLYGDGSNLTGITAGLSNIVEDTSPQLGGNLDTNGKLINFGDSSGGTVNRLQFGDGEELKLFHGSNGNSYFQSTVGGTFIRVAGTNEIALQSDGGSKNMIRAVGNGAVELYHNNTKRIETTSTGVLCLRYAFDTDNYITCNNSANTMEFVLNNTDIGEFSGSGLLIRDSMQLRVGTGNDTRFYHSGTHSYIKHAGTGNFYIDIGNDDLFAITMAESEHLANFTGNGAVELFHNGSKKFETLSYGVQVTGAITASNNINFGNNTAKFMSGSANQLQMYYDGSNAYINNTVASQLKFATNNTVRCQLQSDGHWAPVANNTYDLGTSSMRWRNLYVDDLQLSNEGSKNDVDGTWGDWTLQEGEDKVFMINNRTGKRYSLKMEEE